MMVSLLAGITVAAFLGLWQIPLKFMLYYHPERAALWFIKPLVFLTTSNINTRVTSTFIEYSGVNVYAGYLTIMITLLLTPLVLYFKKISLSWKLVSALSLGLLLVNLVLTKGRAAYITLIATLIYIACQNDRLRRPLLMAILIASICAVTAVPMVRNSVLEIFSATSVSNQERALIYKPAFEQALNRPIFGYGDGHSGRKVVMDKSTGQWIESKDKVYFTIYTAKDRQAQADYYASKGIIAIQRPHNIFLTTIIDTGLFGCLALIYLFICLIQATRTLYLKRKDDLQYIFALGLSGAFISIVVYGLFHDSLNARPYAMLFWILLGLTGAALKVTTEHKSGKTYVTRGKKAINKRRKKKKQE
jgi:O-antigen ligase